MSNPQSPLSFPKKGDSSFIGRRKLAGTRFRLCCEDSCSQWISCPWLAIVPSSSSSTSDKLEPMPKSFGCKLSSENSLIDSGRSSCTPMGGEAYCNFAFSREYLLWEGSASLTLVFSFAFGTLYAVKAPAVSGICFVTGLGALGVGVSE